MIKRTWDDGAMITQQILWRKGTVMIFMRVNGDDCYRGRNLWGHLLPPTYIFLYWQIISYCGERFPFNFFVFFLKWVDDIHRNLLPILLLSQAGAFSSCCVHLPPCLPSQFPREAAAPRAIRGGVMRTRVWWKNNSVKYPERIFQGFQGF